MSTENTPKEYWQSDAVAFAEWLGENYLYTYNKNKWIDCFDELEDNPKVYTTEQLYQEFIKQTQDENTK